MKKFFIIFAILLFSLTTSAADIVWGGREHVAYSRQEKVSPVVEIALNMFSSDMKAVTGKSAQLKKKAKIVIYQLDMLSNKEFKQVEKLRLPITKVIAKKDAFLITTKNGHIYIIGSNGRGTAYGILEMSRMAGVSPWIWWGDVVPERKNRLTLPDGFETLQSPSVEFRGVFINDEDWSLRRWSHTMLDRNLPEGAIGPRTYNKIFKLLLRLRANTIWPAMHPGTKAFFKVKGNKEVADSFDIYVGTSHCEPLLSNAASEWDDKQQGQYNYFTNKDAVHKFWTSRLDETKGMDAIYTLGMRGKHDSRMYGAKTFEDQQRMLQQVIYDQRNLLKKHVNKDLKALPQVFVPYKEVLEVLDRGLQVPEDVTLMWCDDNYGYLTRMPDAAQQKRSGGGGVYYHLSYWGQPHDYLWLTTTQPGLLYHEMRKAYDHNARRMWIVNVHDPKIAAYDLSLFLDMAWNINSVNEKTLYKHLSDWLAQQFGTDAAKKLLPAMAEFYRLTYVRKPEFMGWNQTELDKKKYERGWSPVSDTDFNPSAFGNELDRYLDDYSKIRQTIESVEKTIRPELSDAYFAAIKYPVYAAAAMATKHLEAQEARQLARPSAFHHDEEALTAAVRSWRAYNEIVQLTNYYNQMARGKWRDDMDMKPRNLLVFGEPKLPGTLSEAEIKKYSYKDEGYSAINLDGCIARNACEYSSATNDAQPIQMLGHSMKAVSLKNGGQTTYNFVAPKSGKAVVRVALIPTQPSDKNSEMRFSVSIDNAQPKVFSLKGSFRSNGWKENVLRGQAVRTMDIYLTKGSHRLTIKALDDYIVLDQWMIDYNTTREFYMFPVKPKY